MCGRYTLTSPYDALVQIFALGVVRSRITLPRYNIAPTQSVPVVRLDNTGERTLREIRWGLVPSWSPDSALSTKPLINARAETVADKPSFRDAFAHRRCLVPADGFFEWQRRTAGKQPFHIRRSDRGLFAFAGLWERWTNPAGEVVDSCVILTTSPNQLVAPLHDRMPVILPPESFERWLDPRGVDLDALVVPVPEETLVAVPVSKRVNRPENDDVECLAEVTPSPNQMGLFD